MKTNIPFSRPNIGEEEIAEVVDTLRSGWLTTAGKTKRFEEDFAKFLGVDYALALNSATAGLHLSLEALGLKAGDKVITTIHTFTATAEVIRYFGADPVFLDVDIDSMNIDVASIEAVLKQDKKVKAIMPVHFAGRPCDMDEIGRLAKAYGVYVVEDAAHAFPAGVAGNAIGGLSDCTVFSFYANKNITTGEGGMITTNDERIAGRIKKMRLHGIDRDVFDRFSSSKPSWYYEVVAPGFKYNLTDIAASIGIHQLAKANEFLRRREEIAKLYNSAFRRIPVITPGEGKAEDQHSWHLYILRLELGRLKISRNRFIELLAEEGIGTSVHYIPLHMHPYWKNTYNLTDEQFPNSTKLFSEIVSLPNYPSLKDSEVQLVINKVTSIIEKHAT